MSSSRGFASPALAASHLSSEPTTRPRSVGRVATDEQGRARSQVRRSTHARKPKSQYGTLSISCARRRPRRSVAIPRKPAAFAKPARPPSDGLRVRGMSARDEPRMSSTIGRHAAIKTRQERRFDVVQPLEPVRCAAAGGEKGGTASGGGVSLLLNFGLNVLQDVLFHFLRPWCLERKAHTNHGQFLKKRPASGQRPGHQPPPSSIGSRYQR